MTITISTGSIVKSAIIFTAGIILGPRIKKTIRKKVNNKKTEIKKAANNKVNDMASKIHKAVDICFDKSIIDIPVWKEE